MSQRHAIRLRGPWWAATFREGVSGVLEAIEADGVDGEIDDQFKTTIPFTWPEQISSDFAGIVRLLRKFNCSAGMSEADEVWLKISSLGAPAEIFINGVSIGASDSIPNATSKADIEFAISKLLKPFNELVILLDVQGETASVLLGDVAIEI